MTRFKVRVTRAITYDVDVVAPTHYQAAGIAAEQPLPDRLRGEVGDMPVVEAHTLCQVGEPWVYGWSGDSQDNSYLGRPDGYMETKDLLVFEAPHGHAFSAADVALLRRRASEIVGPVAEHWNGAGCSGLSIRLTSPFGTLTKAQVAAIMGPR